MTVLLAADVGNTNIVLGAYDGAKLVATWRTATRSDQTEDELAIMVDLGMSPLSAIGAATRTAARAIGREDIGLLAAGKLADIAIWDGDPLADIRVLQRPPRAVFLGGKRVA